MMGRVYWTSQPRTEIATQYSTKRPMPRQRWPSRRNELFIDRSSIGNDQEDFRCRTEARFILAGRTVCSIYNITAVAWDAGEAYKLCCHAMRLAVGSIPSRIPYCFTLFAPMLCHSITSPRLVHKPVFLCFPSHIRASTSGKDSR